MQYFIEFFNDKLILFASQVKYIQALLKDIKYRPPDSSQNEQILLCILFTKKSTN